MLNGIISFSIRNKLIIGILTFALILYGGYSVTRLPIDAVPDITNNQVQVITVSPSLAATEVERLVTFPVEQTMATIPRITEMRSFSRFGLSVVTIVFTEDTDVYWARQQVSERLEQARSQIPTGSGSPQLAPLTTGLGEIYQYIIYPKIGYEKKYSASDLRTIQDWIVRRQLLGTEGVADVSSWGGYLKQYEVAPDPEKMRSLDITTQEVLDALERNNQNTGGAYIDQKPFASFIRSEGLATSLQDIGEIVIKQGSAGVPILIRHVADVRYGHAVRYGAMTRNADGEVVGAVVLMLKGANSSRVIQKVKERMAEIEKTLPEGVEIAPYLDRTKLVKSAISTVTRNLTEGALIVIFVLLLLLGNIRAGLIVASVIPLALLFAIVMMNWFGVSGNLMSLGAIDFGLIVDGAVIIVEATMHHLVQTGWTRRLTQTEMDEEVGLAAKGMMRSAAFGQIIILIVYLPILTLVGIEGKMFKPMAQTVGFCIVGALILSLTYVPMISSLALGKSIRIQRTISDRLIDRMRETYGKIIRAALRNRRLVLVGSAAALTVIVLLFFRLGGEFLPQLDEGDFAVDTRLLTGSSLSQSVEAAQRSARVILKDFPEVREVVSKIGNSEIPTDPMPIEAFDLILVLKEKSQWTSASTQEELADKISARLAQTMPGVTFGFQQPIQMRFNELITGARQDVVIKVYGEDLGALADYARRIGQLAGNVRGAQDIFVEPVEGLTQIVVKFDRSRLAQFGIPMDNANRILRSSFAGESAGLVFENEKRFDLVVRLDEDKRKSIDDIKSLYVNGAGSEPVRLDQVADVFQEVGPNQIQRDDAKRRIAVGFNIRGRDVQSIVEELDAKIQQHIKFQPGYFVRYGGSFKNLEEAKQRLFIAVPVALGLIFLLLFFTFDSVRHGLLIFTAIPLSAIGGVLALWIRGMPLSISADVGFIALFGVAVLNGIVLLAEFNRIRKSGITDIQQVVLQGTDTRLRPVLITALVASLGFLPMALSRSAGAEVQRPLATVVIGGLISATVLTLVVLPVLYTFFEKNSSHESQTHIS